MSHRFLYTMLVLSVALFSYADEKEMDTRVLRSLATARALPQERVYLHFDNNGYYLGETMWFKAYCIAGNGTSITDIPQSRVLYVELCAPEGYVVETKKYKLDDKGCCNGEFELKPSLLSGYYEVRAYTRYMLNWGDDAIFSRVFPIYDKVNGDNYDFKNMLDRKRGILINGEWMTQEKNEPTLTFYPEGGHLVDGIEIKVAYELRCKEGKPCNDSITIFADGEQLLTTAATHNGKGYFVFTPQRGISYHAKIRQDKKDYKYSLPEIEKNGATVSVRHDNDSIHFHVSTNMPEENMGLVILNRNLVYVYKKNTMHLTMHRNKLREGVNRCLLLASDGTPLCERMFFVRHLSPQQGDIHPVMLKAEINGLNTEEKNAFKPYHKLTVKISSEDGTQLPKDGCYSISVGSEQSSITTSYSNDLYAHMLLSSEVKGYIPDAAQYFANDSNSSRDNLDLIMLTHGWTAYDWGLLAWSDTFSLKHPIEKGIQVKGSFIKKEKVKKFGKLGTFKIVPLKDVNVRFDISYGDNTIDNYEFVTGDNGRFTLELEDFYGKKYASLTPVLTGKQIQDTIYKFSLDKYFSPSFAMYDYWQRNTGCSIKVETTANDRFVYLDEVNLLEEVDIVKKKHRERATRPPRSEIRLDFMDEWEYAQDINYIYTPNDNWMTYKVGETSDIMEDVNISDDREHELFVQYDYLSESNYISDAYNIMAISSATDNWRVYGWEGPRYYGYENVLTAYEVLQSAFWRHNYNWAYWVKMIVPQGIYSSDKVPTENKEYLKGQDPIKMMDFKEIVIRSDEPTVKQFRNENWFDQREHFINKHKFRSFYFGFMLRSSITPKDDEQIDGYPGNTMFLSDMARRGLDIKGARSSFRETYFGTDSTELKGYRTNYNTDIIFGQKMYPEYPNYVACFIPNEEEDRVNGGIIPELAVKTTRRYTRVQGYSKSKKFYSPDYTGCNPNETTKDYRRTLLWDATPTVGDDGCITLELYNGSNECVPVLNVWGVNGNCVYRLHSR